MVFSTQFKSQWTFPTPTLHKVHTIGKDDSGRDKDKQHVRPRSRMARFSKRNMLVPMTVDAIALQSLDIEDLKNRIFFELVAIVVVKSVYCTTCKLLHWGVSMSVCKEVKKQYALRAEIDSRAAVSR